MLQPINQHQAVSWIVEHSDKSSDGEMVFNKTVPERMLTQIENFVRALPADMKKIEYKPFYLNWTDGKNWYEITLVKGILHNRARYEHNRVHIRFIAGLLDA